MLKTWSKFSEASGQDEQIYIASTGWQSYRDRTNGLENAQLCGEPFGIKVKMIEVKGIRTKTLKGQTESFIPLWHHGMYLEHIPGCRPPSFSTLRPLSTWCQDFHCHGRSKGILSLEVWSARPRSRPRRLDCRYGQKQFSELLEKREGQPST